MPNAIPEGFHTVTPYLVVPDAAKLIDFLKRAFGATERYKMQQPDGTVAHAELRIGDSVVMVGQAGADRAHQAMLYLYVADCDTAYKTAIGAGATSVREPATQFYGDRNCAVKDPLGNEWWIGTHVEDVAPEEITRRMKAQAAA
jgi:PhnB protein